MNIVDLCIILFIIAGGFIGFKRGFIKELVSCVGFTIVVVAAFLLKNPVSVFLYEHLPFFKFGGVLKGVTVLNILLYEIIAFLVIFGLLMVILKAVLLATTLFEAILNATIVLGIPSKILGAMLGIVQYFILAFIILYVISLPFFHVDFIEESKLKNKILTSTPILSSFVDKGFKVVDEFASLKEKYESDTNANHFNLETLDLFLKYDVVTIESVERLVEMDKLVIDNIDSVLMKYKEG